MSILKEILKSKTTVLPKTSTLYNNKAISSGKRLAVSSILTPILKLKEKRMNIYSNR